MNLAYLEGMIGTDAVSAVWTLAKILAITVPIILSVAYLTLAERKVIGYMQVRIGPNRVGLQGPAAALRRRAQTAGQGNHHPVGGQQVPVHPGARAVDHAGAGGMGGDPVLTRAGAGQRQMPDCCT